MRVLLPDFSEFRELQQSGERGVVGVEFDFYSRTHTPDGPADGVVLWFASEETRQKLLQIEGLKWVLTLTAGIDHVYKQLPAGVQLYNANRLHATAVAVHVVAGILSAVRGFYHYRDAQNKNEWAAPKDVNASGLSTLAGKKVVLWGYGTIGKQIEQLLAPFGATIKGIRSGTPADELEVWLEQADWVVLLLPSTPETQGIVNAKTLAKLKKGAWLSNQGRGNLIVTDDLLSALNSGHLGGAVLDVTDPEPLPAGHPLWQQPNVVITPHIASTTNDLIQRGATLTRNFVLDMQQNREVEGLVEAGRSY